VGELVDHLLARDVVKGLEVISRVVWDGDDPRQFNRQVVDYLRELLLIKVGDDSSLVTHTRETLEEMKAQAGQISMRDLVRTIKLFNQASHDLKASPQSQLPLELALVDAVLNEEQVAKETVPPGTRQGTRTASQTAEESEAPSDPPSTPVSEQPRAVKEKRGNEEPGATSSGLELSLDTINGQWGRILGQTKLKNHSVEALLKSCRPLAVEGREVVLGFYYPFHKEKIEEPRNKDIVESVISQVVAGSCHIRCVLSPRGEARGQPLAEPARSLARDAAAKEAEEKIIEQYSSVARDPLIQEAVRKYGAQVVEIVDVQ
jgi:DNA polymerase-3 subunit gamma/tau